MTKLSDLADLIRNQLWAEASPDTTEADIERQLDAMTVGALLDMLRYMDL